MCVHPISIQTRNPIIQVKIYQSLRDMFFSVYPPSEKENLGQCLCLLSSPSDGSLESKSCLHMCKNRSINMCNETFSYNHLMLPCIYSLLCFSIKNTTTSILPIKYMKFYHHTLSVLLHHNKHHHTQHKQKTTHNNNHNKVRYTVLTRQVVTLPSSTSI